MHLFGVRRRRADSFVVLRNGHGARREIVTQIQPRHIICLNGDVGAGSLAFGDVFCLLDLPKPFVRIFGRAPIRFEVEGIGAVGMRVGGDVRDGNVVLRDLARYALQAGGSLHNGGDHAVLVKFQFGDACHAAVSAAVGKRPVVVDHICLSAEIEHGGVVGVGRRGRIHQAAAERPLCLPHAVCSCGIHIAVCERFPPVGSIEHVVAVSRSGLAHIQIGRLGEGVVRRLRGEVDAHNVGNAFDIAAALAVPIERGIVCRHKVSGCALALVDDGKRHIVARSVLSAAASDRFHLAHEGIGVAPCHIKFTVRRDIGGRVDVVPAQVARLPSLLRVICPARVYERFVVALEGTRRAVRYRNADAHLTAFVGGHGAGNCLRPGAEEEPVIVLVFYDLRSPRRLRHDAGSLPLRPGDVFHVHDDALRLPMNEIGRGIADPLGHGVGRCDLLRRDVVPDIEVSRLHAVLLLDKHGRIAAVSDHVAVIEVSFLPRLALRRPEAVERVVAHAESADGIAAHALIEDEHAIFIAYGGDARIFRHFKGTGVLGGKLFAVHRPLDKVQPLRDFRRDRTRRAGTEFTAARTADDGHGIRFPCTAGKQQQGKHGDEQQCGDMPQVFSDGSCSHLHSPSPSSAGHCSARGNTGTYCNMIYFTIYLRFFQDDLKNL